jgi:hypothetical protein
MKQASLAVFVAASVALSGCSLFRAAQQGFHSSFRTSFKKSFVTACESRPGLSAAYCGCAADDIASRYTDEQLMAMSGSDTSSMRDALAHAQQRCASKLPK